MTIVETALLGEHKRLGLYLGFFGGKGHDQEAAPSVSRDRVVRNGTRTPKEKEKEEKMMPKPNYRFFIYVNDRSCGVIETVEYYLESPEDAEHKAHQIAWMGVSLQDSHCIIAAGNIRRVTWEKI